MSRRQKTSSPASVPVSIQIHTKHGGCRLRSTGFGSDLDIKCKREREREKRIHTHTHTRSVVFWIHVQSWAAVCGCRGWRLVRSWAIVSAPWTGTSAISMSESLVFQVYTGYLQQTHYIYISIKKKKIIILNPFSQLLISHCILKINKKWNSYN